MKTQIHLRNTQSNYHLKESDGIDGRDTAEDDVKIQDFLNLSS